MAHRDATNWALAPNTQAASSSDELSSSTESSSGSNADSSNIDSTSSDGSQTSGSESSGSERFATPEMPRYYADHSANRSAQWQSTNLSKSINFFYNQSAIDVAASKVVCVCACHVDTTNQCVYCLALGAIDALDHSVLGQEC